MQNYATNPQPNPNPTLTLLQVVVHDITQCYCNNDTLK